MKKNITTLFLATCFLTVLSFQSNAQVPDTWTQKADVGTTIRYGAVGFSIGSKGYIGTGLSISDGGKLKDMWEYDPSLDTWTQKADFGGTARVAATGFSIGDKGYIGCGDAGSIATDFWEFDPIANTWTVKSSFPGTPRYAATGFGIGTKGYLGTGLITGLARINDFWEFDPNMGASGTWTEKSKIGGATGLTRDYAAAFTIGNIGYVGTGNTDLGRSVELWAYDPSTDTWTRKQDFGGTARFGAIGMSIGQYGYIGHGDKGGVGVFTNDFWEYNPVLDSWTQKANIGGAIRTLSVGFGIGNKGYVGTGANQLIPANYMDFWEYTPSCRPAAITSQPTSQPITYGEAASFTVVATDAVSYQWQEDAGSGFVDITDGGIYSNATTDTLDISLPTGDMSGFKYRCVITGNCLPNATSDGNATLTVALKALNVTAEDKMKCEDGLVYSGVYSVTLSGFITGEDQSVLGGALVIGGTAVTATTFGTYSIDPSGFTSVNYSISYINGSLLIKPTPVTPIITRSGDTLISSATAGNQWYKDGLEITGATDPKYLVTANGDYYSIVTDNGCSSAQSNSISVIDVSIKEVSSAIFDIYPNPSNGKFSIKLKTAGNEVYNVEIFNSFGALVWKQDNTGISATNSAKIDLEGLTSGLYTIVLRNKTNSFVKKVFIKK